MIIKNNIKNRAYEMLIEDKKIEQLKTKNSTDILKEKVIFIDDLICNTESNIIKEISFLGLLNSTLDLTLSLNVSLSSDIEIILNNQQIYMKSMQNGAFYVNFKCILAKHNTLIVKVNCNNNAVNLSKGQIKINGYFDDFNEVDFKKIIIKNNEVYEFCKHKNYINKYSSISNYEIKNIDSVTVLNDVIDIGFSLNYVNNNWVKDVLLVLKKVNKNIVLDIMISTTKSIVIGTFDDAIIIPISSNLILCLIVVKTINSITIYKVNRDYSVSNDSYDFKYFGLLNIYSIDQINCNDKCDYSFILTDGFGYSYLFTIDNTSIGYRLVQAFTKLVKFDYMYALQNKNIVDLILISNMELKYFRYYINHSGASYEKVKRLDYKVFNNASSGYVYNNQLHYEFNKIFNFKELAVVDNKYITDFTIS